MSVAVGRRDGPRPLERSLRRFRLAKAPGLDTLQLLADRDVDDPPEIAVGYGRAHQGL
jgi:hypothetical protein